MSRLVIDMSPEQHKKIKVLATIEGKSMKDYVLDQILHEKPEEESWKELEQVLMRRIESAENKPPAKKTFEDVTNEILNPKA